MSQGSRSIVAYMKTHHAADAAIVNAPPEYVSSFEASLLLNRAPDTVRLLARRGHLATAVRTRAGRLYFRRDVEQLAARLRAADARASRRESSPTSSSPER